jgi:hypothetical protein
LTNKDSRADFPLAFAKSALSDATNAFDGQYDTHVAFSEITKIPASLGMEWETNQAVGSILLRAPMTDGAMELVLEVSNDGIQFKTVQTLRDLGQSRSSSGACYAARKLGGDLITLDTMALTEPAATKGCASANVYYALDKMSQYADVDSCAGPADNTDTSSVGGQDCASLIEGKPGSMYKYSVNSGTSFTMTLTLSAGSSIDAIETFIGTDDIMDTGFSGLTVTLDDAASVVYSSEKMWGQPSTGSKYTEVDTNFRWGEWNTHRFDKKYDGVTKVKLTFQHAKQAAKLGFSMHQVRVNQVSVANDAWTLAGSIARGSGATALRAVPYAAKWMLKDFVADTGGTSCVAKVEVRGRDIGSRLSDCINLHCEAAFPIGSESAASGYTDSCKTGCHLGAKLWSENAAGKALTACSGFDADLRDSCSVGQKKIPQGGQLVYSSRLRV